VSIYCMNSFYTIALKSIKAFIRLKSMLQTIELLAAEL
jgi:hypothetical protein